MAKLPYGGHDSQPDTLDSWGFLEEIAESLKNGELVRPQLARWLGEAIFSSKRNEKKLLIALALNMPRGGFAMNPNDWLKYGEILYNLEILDGLSKEDAISKVLEKLAINDGRKERFSRATLQRWRKKYVDAKNEHDAIRCAESNANE